MAKQYTKDFFIDMNMQNPPKPKSMNWFVRKADHQSIPEYTVEGWEFTIDQRDDSLGIAEGFSPKLNFRRAFLPEEGHYWLSRDFAGQELRILANLSGETVWIKTFLDGGDLHEATAITIWGKEHYTKEKRKAAKAINFGIVYGTGAESLGKTLGISTKEAQAYIDTFFEKLPNIGKFLHRCAILGAQNKETSNIYGRKRRLKSYINAYGKLDGFGKRKSFNHPVQSLGADITKIALIKIYNNILENPIYKDTGQVYFMSTIHDEINLSVKFEVIKEVTKLMGEAMLHIMPGYPVPIITEIEIGHSMGLTWKFDQDLDTLELTPRYTPLKEIENE